MMKPSEQCTRAGLRGLIELSELTGVSIQTLSNWFKHKKQLFDIVIAGAIYVKSYEKKE